VRSTGKGFALLLGRGWAPGHLVLSYGVSHADAEALLRPKSDVLHDFEAMLTRIAAEARRPTEWELECLRSALIMMAAGDYAAADHAIKACDRRPGEGEQSAWTIDDLRAAMAIITAPDKG
jgi:hypothetical protein